MQFFGRKEELNILYNAYSNDSFESIIMYGRRRIGKSELIKKSYENIDSKNIYFECLKASEELNVGALSKIIGEAFNIPTPSFSALIDALEFVFSKSIDEKIILVIDEYPYLRGTNDYYDSVIQNVIDKYKMNSKMKFILCGSYIDIMQEIIDGDKPLYGRFTIKFNIKQMNYLESSLFYPNASLEDKVKYYSVFGGVPYYNQYIDDKLSVKENIINLIASSNARLLVEAENFLSDEMTKLKNANECFSAVAFGNKSFSDILNKSHISSSPTLSDILRKLINMDVLEKIYPINDENEKKSTYRIKERLSLFYYKYIFLNKSYLKTMPADLFYDEFISTDFESQYVPKEFERIASQYLELMNKNKLISPVLYKIGTFYYDDKKNRKNGEFDVVTLNKYGYDFYEVKFTKNPIDDSVVNEEKYQLNNLNIKYNKLGFVSKSGFDITNSDDYNLITLENIYNLEIINK